MSRRSGIVVGTLVMGLLSACFARHGRGSGDDGGTQGGGPVAGSKAPKPGGSAKLPEEPPRCVVSASNSEIAITNVDKVDLLFVIDNGPTMDQEQKALVAEFPRLIGRLATGAGDFAPAKDIHLAVVSSDMGAVGVPGLYGCEGFGDDGIMNDVPNPMSGCHARYPRFLSFASGVVDPAQTARDLTCLAILGTGGCQVRQPLEAALKALWSGDDYGLITFLPDANGFGATGHGTAENAGFLRTDVAAGPAVLAIVVVTDGDDCSTGDPRFLTPTAYLDPNDPLAEQSQHLRCFFNPAGLYPLERYIQGYKRLYAPDLVVFSVIAGIPEDLVSDSAAFDWRDPADRDRFYARALGDERMIETIDPRTSGQDANLRPTCSRDATGELAYPPRRLVQVASGFGENGSIHSLCGGGLPAAIDGIATRIGSRLGGPCLPRALSRGADGTVGCEVEWLLPPGPFLPGTPSTCEERQFPFLWDPDSGEPRTDENGGAICEVAQLAVVDGLPNPTKSPEGVTLRDGWYYDDFSEEIRGECAGRVAFTPTAKPPAGVQVRMRCTGPVDPPADGGMCSLSPASGDHRAVGNACKPRVSPEGGLDDSQVYIDLANPSCSGAPCVAYHLRGDLRSDCVERPASSGEPEVVCPSPQDVRDRVYCTCRCDAPAGGPECACPDGFSCVPVFDQGGPASGGSYCIRNGTFTE